MNKTTSLQIIGCKKAPSLHSNSHVEARILLLQDGASKEVTTQKRRHRRVNDQSFHLEYTRGRWGGTTTSPPRGKAAPTGVADTGVTDDLSFRSVRSPPTPRQGSPGPTPTAKGRGHHGYNRASRSTSGQGTSHTLDLARDSQRCPPCRPHSQGTQPTPCNVEPAVKAPPRPPLMAAAPMYLG